MQKKIFSILSALFFAGLVLPLVISDSAIGFNLLDAILDVHLLLPVFLGAAGIVLGFMGLKRQVRLYLVFLNVFISGFYILATLMGLYGFKEP